MVENSKIEWTDHTFNPWVGCTKVSPACDHCYAEAWAKRTGQAHLWTGERRHTSTKNWRQPFAWNIEARESGVRRRVFCASLADVFDNKVPRSWRDELWLMISLTPHLDWLLLTKRPQNITKMLPGDWGDGWPNVWLGTTVENKAAEDRIDHLRRVPARVRFLSCEPLLELITPDLTGIDWVICGGESGPGAREMKKHWAAGLMALSNMFGAAFFMKQMTAKAPIPDYLMVREFPDVSRTPITVGGEYSLVGPYAP